MMMVQSDSLGTLNGRVVEREQRIRDTAMRIILGDHGTECQFGECDGTSRGPLIYLLFLSGEKIRLLFFFSIGDLY